MLVGLVIRTMMKSTQPQKWILTLLIAIPSAYLQYPAMYPVMVYREQVPVPFPVHVMMPRPSEATSTTATTTTTTTERTIGVVVPVPMPGPTVQFAVQAMSPPGFCVGKPRPPYCPPCPPCLCYPSCTPSFFSFCSSCHQKCRCKNPDDAPIPIPPLPPKPLPAPVYPMPVAPAVNPVMMMPYSPYQYG